MQCYEGLPAAANVEQSIIQAQLQQDRPPLTFRQQGIIAAAMGAAMIGFYTLVGML